MPRSTVRSLLALIILIASLGAFALDAQDEFVFFDKLMGDGLYELASAEMEAFLQQNALDPIDTYCPPVKQFKMLKIIIDFYRLAERVIGKGVPVFKVKTLPVLREIMRMKISIPNDKPQLLDELHKTLKDQFSELERSVV